MGQETGELVPGPACPGGRGAVCFLGWGRPSVQGPGEKSILTLFRFTSGDKTIQLIASEEINGSLKDLCLVTVTVNKGRWCVSSQSLREGGFSVVSRFPGYNGACVFGGVLGLQINSAPLRLPHVVLAFRQ